MTRRLALLLLLLMTIGAYASLWSAGFVYEDQNYNTAITHPLQGVSDPRISVVHARVLTDLSFAANAATDASPRAYHLTNLALHLAVGLVLAGLLASLGAPWGGVLAAGVLWLHPLASETVAYVSSGRGELLATLGVLLALWAMLADRPWLAFACGVLALMAKESTAAGLLLLWPLTAHWRRGRVSRTAWALMAVVGLAVVVVGAQFWVRTPHVWHLGLASGVLLSQAFRLIVPLDLTVDYARLPWSPVTQGVTLAVVWLLLLETAWRSRTWRWALFAVTACLLPRLLMPQAELPHEHAWYLPLSLLALAGGVSVSDWFKECACLFPTAKPSTFLTPSAT